MVYLECTVLAGQAFWTFLSGYPNLYSEIIEPVGSQARAFSADLEAPRAALEVAFTEEIAEQFAHPVSAADWRASRSSILTLRNML